MSQEKHTEIPSGPAALKQSDTTFNDPAYNVTNRGQLPGQGDIPAGPARGADGKFIPKKEGKP